MATSVSDLIRQKVLVRISPALRPRELPSRELYGTLDFARWLKDDLQGIPSTKTWGGDMPARDQVAILFAKFVAGYRLNLTRQFGCVSPHAYGVWELKTGDVRILGWFHRHDCFMAAAGEDAHEIKERNGYALLCQQVATTRDGIDLPDPKFVAGRDPRNVISD